MNGQLMGEQIRERIDANNKKIHDALNRFVLTDEINRLMKENFDLRTLCKHEFVDGVCKYCDTPEERKHD